MHVAIQAVQQHNAEFKYCCDLKTIHKIKTVKKKNVNYINKRTYESAHKLVLRPRQPYGLNIP